MSASAAEVSCPQCHAAAGQPCTGTAGFHKRRSTKARTKAREKARMQAARDTLARHRAAGGGPVSAKDGIVVRRLNDGGIGGPDAS